MKIAYKKTAASDAGLLAKFGTWYTKVRLVTAYPHGGVVIGDTLYHSNAANGLHKTTFTEAKWDLFDVGTEREAAFLGWFKQNEGKLKYGWLKLLGFTTLVWVLDLLRKVPVIGKHIKETIYCYEVLWVALTGERPSSRVTPELILAEISKT
jgi:hypothetical protein